MALRALAYVLWLIASPSLLSAQLSDAPPRLLTWPADLPPSPIPLPSSDADAPTLRRWLVTHTPTLLSATQERRFSVSFRRDTLVLMNDLRDEPLRQREEIRLPLAAIRRDTLYTEDGAAAPMLSDDGPDGKTYGIVLTTPFAVRRWLAVGSSDLREMERMDQVFFFNAATRRDKAEESAALLALVRVIQQLAVASTTP